MTTLNEARDAAYKRAIAEWLDADDPTKPLVPFCFDDETFDPPTGDDGRGAPWARFSVRNLTAGQSTLGKPGNRKYTRTAIVRAEVYTVPGSGLQTSDQLCQAALNMYEGRYLAGVLMYDGQTAEVGLVDDGRWFLSTMQTSFDYEQIK